MNTVNMDRCTDTPSSSLLCSVMENSYLTPQKEALSHENDNNNVTTTEGDVTPARDPSPRCVPTADGDPTRRAAADQEHNWPKIPPSSVGSGASGGRHGGSFETTLEDGSREVIYANGNTRTTRPDGSVLHTYYNGDTKEVNGEPLRQFGKGYFNHILIYNAVSYSVISSVL